MTATPLVETRGLTKEFPVGSSVVRMVTRKPRETLVAVDDVSLSIERGETLGVVGESGSGKSTLGRLLLQLERPTAGDILFEGRSIVRRQRERPTPAAQAHAGRLPGPVLVAQPDDDRPPDARRGAAVHKIGTKETRAARIDDLLERVGLSPDARDREPHQFSGGQRQRIGIARALAVEPDFIVADEAVSALDVSIQAQVLNLLMRLQDDLGLTYLFISHNLSVAQHISNPIAVMYLGRIVEQAPTDELFASRCTRTRRRCSRRRPKPVPRRKTITPAITGDIPNPIDRPSGCHFHPRCPFAMDICRRSTRRAREPAPSRMVKCHLYAA